MTDHAKAIKEFTPMIIKYLFSVCLVLLTFFVLKSKRITAFSLLELIF